MTSHVTGFARLLARELATGDLVRMSYGVWPVVGLTVQGHSVSITIHDHTSRDDIGHNCRELQLSTELGHQFEVARRGARVLVKDARSTRRARGTLV